MNSTKSTEEKEMTKNVSVNNGVNAQAGKTNATAMRKQKVGASRRRRSSPFIKLGGHGSVNLKMYPSVSLLNSDEAPAIILRERSGRYLWVEYTERPDAQEDFKKIWDFLTPAKNSLCIERTCIIPMEGISQAVVKPVAGVDCLLIIGARDRCLSIISSADFDTDEDFESIVDTVQSILSGSIPNTPILFDYIAGVSDS